MANNQEVILKLQEIETVLQDQENSTAELKHVVEELRGIVHNLDRDRAVQDEKVAHLIFRIEQLQNELKILETKHEKGSDKQRQLIENALMAILGGLIAYIFKIGK